MNLNKSKKSLCCDYLIIGSGLTGMTAAIELSKFGKVIVATKAEAIESNSFYAQGGIACVMDSNDSLDKHVTDTLNSGCGLSNEIITRKILYHGKECIKLLEKLGLRFDLRKDNETEYDLGKEGGHSHRRILHCGDITGQSIMRTLHNEAKINKNIKIIENFIAIDLITTSWLKIDDINQCIGAYFLDKNSNKIYTIQAGATLLACGGLGKVYPYTSNPDIATGDGIAMAWRAGLPIRNMEFIQFHPTCLYHPDAKSFLISEAVRGEGAKLIDVRGKSFMNEYDSRGSLATRDITARAIDSVMKTNGDAYVYLDITHRSESFLRERFPNLYAACLRYGINMSTDKIPVVPAAHYSCGGIIADIDGGTEIKSLYAAGEVANTGLHGANRLASNSLLEAIVCGKKTAESMCINNNNEYLTIDIPPWKKGIAVSSDEVVVVEHNWNEVRSCMWDYVGIVRSEKRLNRAKLRIQNLRKEIKQYYSDYVITSDLLELRNLADVAHVIIRSALNRKESRGLHHMVEYPNEGEKNIDTIIQDEPGGPLT